MKQLKQSSKNIAVLALATLFFTVSAQANCDQMAAQSGSDTAKVAAAAPSKKSKKSAKSGPADAEVLVKGMTCEACATSIRQQFRTEAAVKETDVDVSAQTVRVYLKPGQTITEARIRELIQPTGFSVESVKLSVVEKKTGA